MVLFKTRQPEISASSTFFFPVVLSLLDKHFLTSTGVLQGRHTEPLNSNALESIENNHLGSSVGHVKFGIIMCLFHLIFMDFIGL